MQNRYPGRCHACGADVPAGAGQYIGGKGRVSDGRGGHRRACGAVWCQPCLDKADHSGPEDRACGDAAYEDACAQACGL